MAHFPLVIPYDRAPNHVPRRDLVLGGADSLWLEVSVIQYDDPSAEAITLTGGIGGPALRMAVWPVGDYPTSWDYGLPTPACGTILWSGNGTVSATQTGTFDMNIPVGTLAAWPSRVAYGLQLDWDGTTGSELLCAGILHVRRAQFGAPLNDGAGSYLLTDNSIPVLEDDSTPVLA